MKLHLPNTLRKALMAVLATSAYFTTAEAGCMHAGVSPTIYTDFGQNMARYSVYQVNDLLTAITARDGILIPYTTGAEPGRLPQDKMISFEGMNNDGAFTAVGYNYTATVAHNGCPNPSFTPRYLGENQAIHYQGVEYRSSQDKAFLLQPSIDYKLTRSSKIFTDITASGVFDVSEYIRNGGDVKNLIHYRAGAGSQDQADFEGNTHSVAGGYAYITGGICETIGFSYQGTSESYPQAYDPFNPEAGPFDNRGVIDDVYTIHVVGIRDYGPNGVGQPTAENPKANLLPFVSRSGDSGSPVWAWNEITQEYELIACHQARGGDNSYSRGASTWTIQTMESFNKGVDMDAAGNSVHLHGAVYNAELSKHISDSTNHVETTTQFGHITGVAGGFQDVYFCGVGPEEDGTTIYTWLSLYALKDTQNWYSYGNTYFNANGNGSGKQMHLGDLFNTENIVFESSGGAVNRIVLDEDVDTGIGYVQFSPKAGGQTAVFQLESNGKTDNRDYMLNSAGYIVDEGAQLHIKVTNTQKDANGNAYFREWRKQGAGDMYIEGTGNNEVFLNLGGKGTTYLKETNGYAAYNVLINNGATVNFGTDIKQIARDVTFGNGGGFLEFSGLSEFTWESGENTHVEADGFTINALTQDATLINSTGSTTLRYVTPGNTTFLGSFQDTASSSLNVIYEGGGTWTLNSIHTKLHAGSKFTVASGTAELVGTNTVHALGSIEGKAGTRYSHPDDWHYADSAMNVEVQSGATFRLGSHARLTGNVNVLDGGTLEIAEGVKHRYEYIEGWLIAEDTYQQFYRDFYGLKGDVTLNGNSTLRFNFSSGTDAENVYGRNISGTGNVDMRLGGSGATLVLSGTNNFTGTKHLAGGGLVAEAYTALGDTTTEKWHVNKDAFIAVKGKDGNTALTYIDGDSTGVLALTQDQAQQVNLNGTHHENMFVGALAGQVVQYGDAPKTMGSRTVYTETALDTVTLNGNKYWQLGGGGGELVVNFLLDDPDSQLVLGNEYTTGTVTLTNAWNRIGSIFFAGKVTLNYTSEEALGGSKISLDYTNRVAGSPSIVRSLTRHSSGAMMLDGMEDDNVDMFEHKELFLGAEGYVDYTGTITPDGGAYRFGGITGTLVLNNALENQAGEQTNLIVDAQTYSGGTLALAAQASITGDVSVMGWDATRPGVSGGDIALRLDVNNAIESARSVTLKEGGILDVNGTSQTLHRFNMEAGSLLTDTSAAWNGTVTLNVQSGETSELRGGVEVNTLVKDGAGTLLLAGDNAYGTLLINEGRVDLLNGNSMSASGVTMVETNGILNLAGGFDVTGSVAFAGGKAMVAGKTLNGSIMVGTDGNGNATSGTLEQEGSGVSTRINSSVEVAQGSTLNLKGTNGTFILTATDINEAGGTIALQGKRLTINRGGEDPVNIGGTIRLEGTGTNANNRVVLYSDGSANNMTRNINHLHIDGGYAAIEEASWNTIWNIHSVTGSGDLLWNSHSSHWFSSQLYLDGANDYAGKFTAQRTGGASNDRMYQAYVELSHDLAAQNMDVDILGGGSNNYMSLAINTDNATMKSLSGNQYAVLYAGVANPGTDQEHEQKGERPLNTQPTSTRSATLIFTGDQEEEAVFAGIVAGGTATDDVPNPGLSIVKNGTGTQTFSGSSVTFNDVEVHGGRLLLTSSAAAVRGNVTLATGTELSVGSWTLDSEHLLTIYGNAAAGSAKFTSAITMDGGVIDFSGLSLGTTLPTLDLGSVVMGTHAVTINFSDSSVLQTGQTYYLSTGDWSGVTISEGSGDLGYMKATFTKDAGGLRVSFDMVGGSHVWDGDSSSHEWTSTVFGKTEATFGADGTAVFTDAAENNEVLLVENMTVKSLNFASSEDYTVKAKEGTAGTVTATSLVQSGSGTTTVSGDVRIGTSGQHGTVQISAGELVLQSAATTTHVDSISGDGTLGIGYGGASDSTIFHESDRVGALHLLEGVSYTANVDQYHYLDVILDSGSTFTLGSDKHLATGAVTTNGDGATIALQNNSLFATAIVLGGNLNLSGTSGSNKTGTLNAVVNGSGHTVNASGTLVIGNKAFNANLDVAASGKVTLKNGAYDQIGTVTLGNSSILQVELGAGISNGATINMGDGASLQMINGNGINQVNANIVMAGNSASITGSYSGNGTYLEGTITGQGTLNLAQEGGHANAWRLDSVIREADGHPLALNINSNVTLTAANSYTGGTTIAGSTVQVNNQNALGTGGVEMTGGTLKLNSNLNVAYLDGTVNGTVQLNAKTLVLTGNGEQNRYMYYGSLGGSGSILKTGNNMQAFMTAASLADVTVNEGLIQLSGGSATGKVSVAENASLYFASKDFTISSAIENAGTVAFSEAKPNHKLVLNPAGSFEQTNLGYIDIDGNEEADNGFAQGTAIKVFNNQDGAKVLNIATVEYLGDTLQLDAVSGIATMGASSSVYSVRKGTVTYDNSFTGHPVAANIQTFSLVSESSSDPATLQLNQGLANGVTILSAGLGGNVGIGEGVTLNQSQLDAQVRTTLTGSGTYALADNSLSLPANVVLGDKDNWTGVVRVSNFAENNVDFSALANANSWVEVCGMKSGFLKPWNGGNLSTNLILTDNPSVGYAMFMNNGSGKAERPVMTVSGKWMGDGTLRNGNTTSTLNLDLKFTGDISGWHGKYEQTGSSSILYFASKDDMEVNASFTNAGNGYYNMVVDTDTTFNGNIDSPDQFTVKTGKTATLAGANNSLNDVSIEENGELANTGYTVLNGDVANAGSISNSGTLEYGFFVDGVDNVTNLAGGTIILNSMLTSGHITNSGTITISSLMQGEEGTYMDANGKTGQDDNPDDNGFATTSFQVLDPTGVITNNGGAIMYCGKDVTAEVMYDGWVRNAANYGAYNINKTDNSVSFSKIYDRSGGALEYISFAEGTSLNVDDAASGTVHLCTSQISAFVGATLNVQNAATLVVDESTLATVEATSGSTISLQLAADAPDTRMTFGGFTPNGAIVNVTGSGVLDIGKGQYNISTLNISGGTVLSSFAGGGGGFSSRGDVQIGSGGTLQLSGVDAIGWSGSNTKSISLLGDADAPAAWELGARQTLSGGTAINMNGNAVIRAMAGHTTGDNAPMLDAYNNTPKITATGTGNVVAVPLRMRTDFTFDVAANGELTLAGGTASGYRGHNVVKNGAGKLIFDELQVNFGEHTYTGALNINAGSVEVNADASFATVNAASALAITGGTTTINAYTGNNGSSLSVEQGASLIFNGTTELAAPITNNGNLSFASGSSVTLNGTFDHGNGTYLDLDTGVSAENGNGLLSGAYVVVSSGSGAHSVAGTIAVTYNSQQYTLHDDGKAYQSFDDSIYHVRNGSANYSRAVASAESITSVDLSNGATLNMQATLAGGVTISSSGGTVVIGDGVVLSRDDLHASDATTVNGTGTYSLNVAEGTSRGENVSFGNDWHGTIRLYGTATENLDLNSVARQGAGYAPLELAGVTASLATGQINPDLVLTNTVGGPLALTVSNAGNFTFAGAISGSGTMANASGGNTVFAFSGADVSDWNGSIQNSSGNLTVNISGMENGGAMGAALVGVNAVSYTGATVQDTYTVSSLQTNDGGTSLTGTNGTLVVGSLSGSGALTISGSVELAGGEYTGSSITVSNESTLRLNGVQAHGAVLSGAGTVKLAADQVTVAGVTASGRIEAEGEGSHTLEIAGTGGVSTASIGAKVDLVMSGTGTQAFNGNLDNFNGAVDVLDGTLTFGSKVDISALTMSGGAISLADGSSLASVRVASGAQASISSQNGGAVALKQAILNPGSLTLAGVFDVSALDMQTRDYGYIAVDNVRTDAGSGFATVQNAIEVVRNVVAGELNVENARVKYNDQVVQLSADGWARFNTGGATNYDTYYLRDNNIANLSVTQIQNAATAGHAELNKIVFDNMADGGVNLVVDTDTSLSLFKVNEDCTANLTLTEGGSIDQPSGYRGVDGFVKLAGSGTYYLHDTSLLGKGVSLADGWQGTVALSGTANTLDLARRGGLWARQEGQAASTVRLDGWTSALTDAGWETNAKVVLGTGGLTVQGSALTGDTAPEYAFNGNVSGEGNITNSRAGAATFTFADAQDWEGSFIGAAGESTLNFNTDYVETAIVADGGKVTANFHGGTVSGSIEKQGNSSLDVVLLDGFTNFTAEVAISSLYQNEETMAIISSDFTTGNIVSSGNIVLNETGSLTVTEGIDTLSATISNAGTIEFANENIVVNLLANGDYYETDSSYRDINGSTSEKGNGFHVGGNVQIISNGGVGVIKGADNVTVNYKGTAYQLLSSGELYNADDIHTYYIHTGTVDYSSVKGAEGLVGLHLDNTLVQGGNPILNLDADLASTMTNGIVSDGGTISIAQGVTLAAASLRAQGDTKLTGQGTYDLGSGVTAFAEHVSLSNDWNGIVRISDAHMSPFTFSNYANNHSSVEVLGISGWWNTGVRDFNGKLILGKDDDHPEKVALKLTDASSNYTYSLNGGVSGEGDYVLAYDSGKRISATTHTIKGDVSNWTGSFIDAVAQTNTAHTATLHFENNTAVNGVVNIAANVKDQRSGREDHKFNVEVVANQGSVHMTGDIEGIDKLTFDPSSSGRTLTIDSLATNDNGTTLEYKDRGVAGTIAVSSLSGSGTLTLHNNNRSSGLANFALNGGDYAGARIDFIAMKADYSAGARCVLLTLGDENVAKDSVIHTTINKTGTAAVNVGIAVNDDIVRVGGLTDTLTSMEATCTYTLVSGNPTGHTSADTTGFVSDSTVRTLMVMGEGGSTQAKVGANLNLAMNCAGGVQKFTGDLSSFNGSIAVQAGELQLLGSSIHYNDVVVEQNGALTIGADANADIHAGKTIVNSGSVNLTGRISLTGSLAENDYEVAVPGTTTYSGTGEYEGSGFLTTTSQYYLVKSTNGGTLNASVTSADSHVVITEQDNSLLFSNSTQGDIYYVNKDLTYNAGQMGSPAKIAITTGHTLSASSEAPVANAVLSGAGTLSLSGMANLGTGVSLDSEGWTGTVKVTGRGDNLDLTGMYTPYSNICLDGWEGYFNGAPTITADVEIGSGGVQIRDGSSSNLITFSGALKGSGNITRANVESPTIKLKFTGDVKDYTGSIIHNRALDGNVMEITFAGDAKVINAKEIGIGQNGAGNLNVNFQAEDTVVNSEVSRNATGTFQQHQVNVNVQGNTEFANTVNVNTLSVATGKTATFTAESTISTCSIASGGTTNFNAQSSIGTYTNNGGTANFNAQSTIGTYTINGGATNFNADVTITTLGTNGSSGSATVTIAKDATVDVNNIANSWGIGTMTVNGTLNVADNFKFSTGNRRNNVVGSGTINTNKLESSNYTNPAAFSGVTLNIGNGGIVGGDKIEFGTMTVGVRAGSTGWTATNGNISLASGATTMFAPGAGQSITMGAIAGAGALEMNGAGTLTLGGNDTYSGGTIVTAGTLVANHANALGSGAVTVNGGVLSLTGSVDTLTGALTVNNGGTLKLSEKGDAAITASGGLSLNDGAILDVSSLGIIGHETAPITLVKGGSIAEPGNVVVYFGQTALEDYTLSVDENSNLVLTFTQILNELIWDGSNGATWDSGNNWHAAGREAGTSAFASGNNVRFDSTSTATASLNGDVAAGDMVVDSGATATVNTNNHNLSATSLTGVDGTAGGTLVKQGGGTASFFGTVNLATIRAQGGITELAAQGTVGTLTVTNVNGNSVSLTDGADITLNGTGVSLLNKAVTIQSGAKLTVGENATLQVQSGENDGLVIAGGTLQVDGNLDVGMRGTGNGYLQMTSGALIAKKIHTGWDGTVNLSGGSLEFVGEDATSRIDRESRNSGGARGTANTGTNFYLGGSDTTLELRATKADWMLNAWELSGNHTDRHLYIGSVSVSGDNTHDITLTHAEAATGTNTITNNRTLTLDTFTIGAGKSVILAGTGTTTLANNLGGGGSLTVDSGTLNLGGGNHTLANLTVNGGTVTTTHSGANGCVSGTININAGGTFQVNGEHDAFGYNDNGATGKIALAGTAGNEARLVLNPSNHGSVTMKTNLELNGNAVIEAQNGAAFNTYGCGITVSSTGNTISGMQVRSNVTVNTADDADLTLTSLAQGTTTDANGALMKTGTGTLILDGATVGNTATTVTAGTLALTQTVDSITGALTVNSGATLKLSEYGNSAVSVGNLTLNSGAILDVSTLDFDTASTNPYTLMRGTTIATPVGVVVDFGSVDPVKYALAVNEGDLVLTFVQTGNNLVWNGGTANWSDQNWHEADTPGVPVSFRDNDSVTFAADAGTATLQGNVIADTMTLESGANLVLNTNGHNLTTLKLNAAGGTSLTKQGTGSATFGAGETVELTSLSVTGGSVAFGGHVTVTGDNYIQPTAGANIAFNDGLSFTGTGGTYGYAIVFGNGSTVTFGGTSDLSTKLIGPQQGSTLALAAGATVEAKGVYNSTTVANNGHVVLEENATLTVGASGLYTPSLTIGSGASVSLGGNSQMSAVTGAGALNVTGGTVQLNGSNTGFTGDVTISGGTLKVGDQKALGEHHEGASQTKKITVATGGTLDLNGKADANFTYTLAGGTLTNSGNAIGDSSSQTVGLQLTANSTVKVDSGHEFRLLARSYDPTKLDLKGNTLEKTGTGQFHLKNTTVTDGIIDIQGGEVKFDGGSTAADVVFDGGTVTGTLTLTGDITLTANRESATSSAITAGGHGVAFAGDADLTVSGVVSGNGTSVAKTGSGTVTLSGANTYSGSTTVDGGTLKSTGTNAQTMAAASIASGAVLEAAGNRTVSGALSGAGTMTYSGESAGTITLNGSVTEFTGTLQNASNADLALSLSAAANQLHMDIASTGDGKVNLSMVHADYNLYGTQTVNNIDHDVNMTMEVRETGDVTATGKVLTGRLVVGEANTETGAVFTLSGADAQLFNNNGEHKYTAAVQGYGTFEVEAGAKQELTSISGFHGTFAADGEGSVLTLNATLGSGTALSATNGGVINLTQTYTMDGDTVVDGGTVSVSQGLTVDGSVDLSKGTLTQTGGTISVNADKSLTLGEASITSAISNGGTVEFTKDITATGLQESTAEVNVGANDTKTVTANHFDGTRTESSIRVVSGDGTVTPGGHKVTQGDVAYTLQQDGTAVSVTGSSVDYATFLQHEAGSSLNSSAITATALQHGKFSVGVDVNNANLNVDSFLASVQATNANITNVADADYIQVLQIAGGSNQLTGSVDDLATMTKFAQGVESSLRIRGAETAQKAGEVVFHGSESERDVTITAAQATGEGYDIYALNNDRFTVESHKMVKVADGNITVGNHIKTDTVSTGSATGSLTLANGADAETLNEVIAASGNVTFLNMAAENETATGGQTSISLNKLEIGAGKTVSFYEAAAPVSVGQLAQEASVSVVGTLTAGQGATLNSDLVMEKGSTLDVRGTGGAGLLMGSEVTLNKGMTLSDYSGEWASWEVGTTYTLFSGVDGLDIGNGVTTGTMDYTAWVDAKEYFSNIQESNRYFLCYGGAPDQNQNAVGVLSSVNDGSNVGMIYIMTVPEPATSTLSLLALAALAARRRRK